MVTQITSVTKFDMFRLSTTVYAWKEKIWTDYSVQQLQRFRISVDLTRGADARKGLGLREIL